MFKNGTEICIRTDSLQAIQHIKRSNGGQIINFN